MSDTSESYYKRYREAVRKLVAQKLDEDFIYENFTEGAYRVILQMKDDDARTDALSFVSECLHNQEKVTDSELKGWLQVWRIEHGKVPEKSEKPKDDFTNVKPADPVTPILLRGRLKDEPYGTEAFQTAASGCPAGGCKEESTCPNACRIGQSTALPEDPLGVAEEFRIAGLKDMELREVRIKLADKLLECYSDRVQMNVLDLIRNNDKGMKTAADVFYFGVESLIENRKRGRK